MHILRLRCHDQTEFEAARQAHRDARVAQEESALQATGARGTAAAVLPRTGANDARGAGRLGEVTGQLPGADVPPPGDVSVFCPTTTPLDPGTPVVVELISRALPNKVLIKATVEEWHPALPRLRVRAGARVRFDESEATKVAFVLDTLSGKRPPTPRRRHTRLPVALPVQVRLDKDPEVRAAELREISVSGALIGGLPPPAVGTEIVLLLTPPGGQAPMDIAGRVLYHAGGDGTGVRFIFREGGGSRRLRELVRRFKQA